MKEPWIVFCLNGKELCAITVRGSFTEEITVTRELLAYENGVAVDDISWKVKTR